MSRYNEIRTELIDILAGLGTEATSLVAVGVPMAVKGFSENEILNVPLA